MLSAIQYEKVLHVDKLKNNNEQAPESLPESPGCVLVQKNKAHMMTHLISIGLIWSKIEFFLYDMVSSVFAYDLQENKTIIIK